MNASESIIQSHLWSLLLTTTDKKQGNNIKKDVLLHLFPFPSIVIFTSCFGVSNSFPCFILLGVSGYLQPHHPLSFIYLPCLSDFVFPLFPHFLPFNFNVQ